MALRNIVKDGDPLLKKKCREVTDFGDRLHQLLEDMAETMIEADGLGLAAPQVGILRRVFVALDVTELGDDEDDDMLEDSFDEDAEDMNEEDLGDETDDDEYDEEDEEELCVIEFINPEILEQKGESRSYEGCLSFPGKFGAIERPTWVKVRAFDRFGKEFFVEAEGLMARCICHEINHLDGVTIDDLAEYFYDPETPHDLDATIGDVEDADAEKEEAKEE